LVLAGAVQLNRARPAILRNWKNAGSSLPNVAFPVGRIMKGQSHAKNEFVAACMQGKQT
jgi:hypothetical protein